MRRRRLLPLILLAGLTTTLPAHHLFLTLASFLVRPESSVRVTALDGTFMKSEHSIARSRIADLSLVGPAGRKQLDTALVAADGPRTTIRIQIGPPGTYVAGLSLRPDTVSLEGAQFDAYLKEEGFDRVLGDRRAKHELGKPVTERRASHGKAVFQAGSALGDNWNEVFGYPAEIIPLRNPYALHPGDTLRLELRVARAAAAGAVAIAGGRSPSGGRIAEQRLRANGLGVVPVVLRSAGTWYVEFVSVTRSDDDDANYDAERATLTFAVPR
jgi:hypothetical protein